MFESEEQAESRSYGLHFLLIFLVIVAVGGGVFYYFVRQQKPLSAEQATPVIAQIIKAKGPAMVHFHVGSVIPSVDEKPQDPHYKLLEKLGYIKLQPGPRNGKNVTVTPLGDGTFARFPEFRKTKNVDGTEGYLVPLANRELVAVTNVTMTGPSSAKVEYTWKWAANKMGDEFEASGKPVQSFSTWDRSTLIQKYGVNFYHAEPAKEAVNMVRTDKGWKLAVE